MWNKYPFSEHCQEYDYLTIEEKLLVDAGMRKWFASKSLQELCVPLIVFRETESRIIEEFKRKETNDRRNRKQSASRRNNK